MKKFYKMIAFLIISILALGTLFGCSSNPESSAVETKDDVTNTATEVNSEDTEGDSAPLTGVTLEFLYNLNGEAMSDAIQTACANFTKDTGIKVEAIMPGSNFSDTMKTRMAADQLPDIWTTHGWAVARYSEYLEPLNDQNFVQYIKPEIKNLITGDDGNVYTAPLDMDLVGIAFNKDVLNAAGVNPEDIKTWDDFNSACQKIKDSDKTPIHIGGKDSYTIGNIFNDIAPTLFTNDNEVNQKALLDGSFDWNQWNDAVKLMADWNDKGYINKDSLTADYMTSVKAMGKGEVGFGFYGADGIAQAYAINSDANIGFIPLPGRNADSEQSLVIGEHFAVGVWKDSKNKDAALQLLNYLMDENVCTELASVAGMPSGVTNVTSDTGKLAEYYTKYSEAGIKTVPYFDRAYLPSGMWSDLCTTGAYILTGESGAVEKAVSQMKASYEQKITQAN